MVVVVYAGNFAARFSMDIRTRTMLWRASVATFAAEVDQFENAVEAR